MTEAGLKEVETYCYLGPDILGGGIVDIAVQVGEMGDDPTHQGGVGRIPPQGCPQAYGVATSESEGSLVGIPPSGGRDGGGGTKGGGDLHLPPPEKILTFHCNQAHYGPVSGGEAETRATDIQAVVGTLQVGCGGDADSGSGGRTYGGGGGYGRGGDGDRLSRWEDTV